MTNEIAVTSHQRLPPVPWRDPYTVSPAKLAEYIRNLEAACLNNPRSADLRTCLGMAYAMNYEVYKSLDALEAAIGVEPDHFFARLKYGELYYHLRVVTRAEEITLQALELASNAWELLLARKQLHDIRQLIREGTQKPSWTKSLTPPVFCLLTMFLILSLAAYWK